MNEPTIDPTLTSLPHPVIDALCDLARTHDPDLISLYTLHGNQERGLALSSWTSLSDPVEAMDLLVYSFGDGVVNDIIPSLGHHHTVKCPNCRHEVDMHWSPQDPPLSTTACRDCLSRQVYVHTPVNGVHEGTASSMCCWTTETIYREVDAQEVAQVQQNLREELTDQGVPAEQAEAIIVRFAALGEQLRQDGHLPPEQFTEVLSEAIKQVKAAAQ